MIVGTALFFGRKTICRYTKKDAWLPTQKLGSTLTIHKKIVIVIAKKKKKKSKWMESLLWMVRKPSTSHMGRDTKDGRTRDKDRDHAFGHFSQWSRHSTRCLTDILYKNSRTSNWENMRWACTSVSVQWLRPAKGYYTTMMSVFLNKEEHDRYICWHF